MSCELDCDSTLTLRGAKTFMESQAEFRRYLTLEELAVILGFRFSVLTIGKGIERSESHGDVFIKQCDE